LRLVALLPGSGGSPILRAMRVALACALALLCLQAPGALGQMAAPLAEADVVNSSATLAQCVTAVLQSERSATFSAEMTAIPGSARMSMRIEVQERMPSDMRFHTVSAPGFSVWRPSEAGVKTYRYVKQVTNLSAPAVFRASVGFRWLTAKGHLIRHLDRRTASCEQPAPPPVPAPGGPPEASGGSPGA
jgi:hypothetical protein